MDEKTKPVPAAEVSDRYLVDSYLKWANGEGIPIHEHFGFDLLAVETVPWARYDARGCFCHAVGRGDFMANYVLELLPGKKTRPVKHLYETVVYVLTGYGSTQIWLPGGETQTFEWGPKSLFAIPLNCKYQLFNGSGSEPARLSFTNDAPLTINLYHKLDFVFDNPCEFPERLGGANHFQGEGEHLAVDRGKDIAMLNLWETNFIPDAAGFTLYALNERGKGSKTVTLVLADGTMHSHISEIPAGRYKKGHRHAAGTHVHALTGVGYTLLWYEGDSEFVEIPWRHGIMYVPPFWMFHQHFNTGPEPARYVTGSMGSRRHPFISMRRKSAEGFGSVSVQNGGRQIEYVDQDPRVHRKWLEAIGKNAVQSQMGDVFDEPAILKMKPEELTGRIQTPQSIGPAI